MAVIKKICLNENKEYPITSFFESDKGSIYGAYGIIPFCKKCIGNTVKDYFTSYNDKRVAIFLTCIKFDVGFFNDVYENVFREDMAVDRLMFAYLEERSNLSKSNDGGFNTTGYSMGIFELIRTYIDSGGSQNAEVQPNWVNYIITEDDLDFWGTQYSQEDYYFLSNTLNSYVESFSHATDNASIVELLKQICYTSLEIRNERKQEKPNISYIDGLTKRLSELLGSANMKPSQKKDTKADVDTFGVLIDRIEHDDPIPNPLPEWEKNDLFKELGDFIVGHIARMIDRDSEASESYEKMLEEYTVRVDDE